MLQSVTSFVLVSSDRAADLVVENVVDGAAAKKVVCEGRLVGAWIERDPLGGSLQIALERNARACISRIVVEANVTTERLP